jgi:hypothetical protein
MAKGLVIRRKDGCKACRIVRNLFEVVTHQEPLRTASGGFGYAPRKAQGCDTPRTQSLAIVLANNQDPHSR